MTNEWKTIKTAPKDRHVLGYDPALKLPFVMLWNCPADRFLATFGAGDECPTHWQELPKPPKS